MPKLTSAQNNNIIGKQLNKLWQGSLASPDRPSLLYGLGVTPLKVLMTGQGQIYRVPTTAQDWYILVGHLWNRTTPAITTAIQIPGQLRISDQTVCNQPREAGMFTRRPVWRFDPMSLSRASAVVPAEGEMDLCQVEDSFVLSTGSFSPVRCWGTHTAIDIKCNVLRDTHSYRHQV